MSLTQVSNIFHPEQGQKAFPVKGQIVNISGFVGRTVTAASTQLCHATWKVATDMTGTDGRGRVPVKFYFWPLKFEFHLLLICHKMLGFFQPLKTFVSTPYLFILSSWATRKERVGPV